MMNMRSYVVAYKIKRFFSEAFRHAFEISIINFFMM